MKAARQLGQEVGVRRACEALGVPRAAFYRRRAEPPAGDDRPRPPSPRALRPEERQQVKDVFFPWYNDEHYHTGIGLVTPAMLHYGQAAEVIQARQQTLEAAYATHPERFVRGRPRPPKLPTAVWINPPTDENPAQKKRLPELHCPQKPDAPLTHPRLGYPLSSCVPAELDSVSPGDHDTKSSLPQQPLNTRAMPQKIPGGLGDWSPSAPPNDQPTPSVLH